MCPTVTIPGGEAFLRWGYYPAATLHAWTVTKQASGWTLAATVTTTDTFRVSQRPLVFAAPTAKGVWRWPIVSLQIEGASLTAVLGPKEP
mgnify:CR=1 FL=1